MLRNLVVGLPTMLVCLALQAVIHFLERPVLHGAIRPDAPGRGPFSHVRPLLIAMVIMMLGNFVQIVIWGVLFLGWASSASCMRRSTIQQ